MLQEDGVSPGTTGTTAAGTPTATSGTTQNWAWAQIGQLLLGQYWAQK